jgi:eukaryotic-like serine/threonine-protein kinase
LVISKTVSHYRIIEKLGEGGMGEVYLAEDTRLGRQVALKFLPASYQYDPERREKFFKEARAASAVHSPNIAAIYDIGEHQENTFIVMEYVKGETLARRIERGPLDVREATEIAAQIAEALDEAHRQGFVHRDIKSSNLMLTNRGLVKVLDFGIATATQPEGTDTQDGTDRTAPLNQQTSIGVVVGTVQYMSPEQALGHKVDHRTDIFSLGVVLYEMLTGRLPFEGKNSTELIDKVLHAEPTAVARFNYSVPGELERIVRKCLEKERDRRYQSAHELAVDFRTLLRDSGPRATALIDTGSRTRGTRRLRSSKAIRSLAVMPFANASDDPEMDYLSDGITETIISNLSQIPRLRVMARSTVFRYKGRDVDPLQIGSELEVRAALVGRVLQRGARLVIKVELVDTSDGAQLWGEQYNRKLEDIFAIEEEISKEISEKLRLRLTGEQKKKLSKRHTENTEAYQLYLKGRYHWNRRTEDALMKSIEYFERAISTDPVYALAYAGLADAYSLLPSYSRLLPAETFPIAKLAAAKALELDDTLAEAHTSLAHVRFWYDWDWSASEAEFKRAVELNPGYATAHLWYALYLAAMERLAEALVEIQDAKMMDPLSLIINLNEARLLFFARKYDQALAVCRKTMELYPDFALAHRRLGLILHEKGMYKEAIEEFSRALALAENDTETAAALGHAYAASGAAGEATRILEQLLAATKQGYVSPYSMTRIYIGLGDHEQSLAWLEKTYEERHGILVYLKVEPLFDPLRTDPRFKDLLDRMF